MTRIDLSDTAIVISVKVDSEDRLVNLERLRNFYTHFGDRAEIRVVEQGILPSLTSEPESRFQAHFLQDGGLNWKTRNMNFGAKHSRREIFLMSDCDTVPHPEALAAGLAQIRNGCAFVHLYDGVVTNISKQLSAELADWGDLLRRIGHFDPEAIDPRRSARDPDVLPLYGNADYRAVGGSFLCRREDFFDVGGWNENLVSYGFEDQEFDTRVRALGHSFPRIEAYNLLHFEHARGPESRYSELALRNKEEFERVRAMSRQDLEAYVTRGFRLMAFEAGHDYRRTATSEVDIWQRTRDPRKDLSDLTILVIADSDTVRYFGSCLKPFLEFLEAGFCRYDLRICENRFTYFKNIHSKTNVTYRTYPQGLEKSDLDETVREVRLARFRLLRLSHFWRRGA